MGGLKQRVACSKLFNTPRCKYHEITAEILLCHVNLLMLNPNVQQKQDLASTFGEDSMIII